MDKPAKRLLGALFDGTPIFEPRPSHSVLMSAAGGGKTTCGAIPWLLSIIGDVSRAVVINDCKDGEIAGQCAALCARYGRKVAVLDDFAVLGLDNPYRVSLTPLGSVLAAHEQAIGEVIFATDNANHALIEEPTDDAKNQYWRDEPRSMIEFVMLALLKRKSRLATPGGIWALLADPKLLIDTARIEAEEGDAALSALAKHFLDMAENNPEHYGQHRGTALKALRIFGAGSLLHHAGIDAEITHRELIHQKYVVFIVGPQRHMARLGKFYALHLQSFVEALLAGDAGPVDFILDEFTNAPLKSLISALTTMRGYGGRCHMIAQSRSEVQRKYGEKETATLEENAVVKQWFGFSSFEEAERVSKAMGETQTVTQGMGISTGKLDYSDNLSTGKDRLISAEGLMRLKPDEQVLHVKDLGFVHCRKVRQNEIAPFCHGDLADNPLEGPQLPADPKVTLPAKKKRKP